MDESRREFLKTGAKSVAAVAAAEGFGKWGSAQKRVGANDRVRVAIVGLRARGENHIKGYAALPNVEIAALCDIDDTVLTEHAAKVRKLGHQPKTYKDIRKLLEDKSIDAISIATPHHWHALMMIWACQAGKDVYVEKPCSHNLWEGGQMVKAAAKYNRIVQHGTQTRSNVGVMDAIQKIRDQQILGDVYLSRGLCFKWRDTIGRTPISPVPPGVDYDLWTGPAPSLPFTKNHFHYNWHWFWNYGNGDLGNQGIHQLDVARWGLGLGFPDKISAIGGHVMFDDDQETPNTLNCAFEYKRLNKKPVLLEFEVRHWMTNHEAGIGAARPANAVVGETAVGGMGPLEGSYNSVGNIFYGPKGYLAIDNVAGYQTFFGRDQKPGPSKADGPEDHFANFIACVVSRKKEDLRAPIEDGHISSGLAHLANVSYRLGRTLDFDPQTQLVQNDEEANRLLRGADRGYRRPFVVPELV
ncbi:Gfo/Idh/MocA family protein [Terriglobus saanensis]|uniref:Oxidoreductase domain protein n=1 Tax=Terriglobus saanensis (strain ATCC BAA-1853 / DSM 23119 / SP1PR4) TaxID=401053 RepID=E8V2N4_TERSS|nr:Gfo/Idh/MocA family oxidoreductase [Terriglobus saanensis]ADV83509.1 oxidoreductase domain protein [Terriglobus saanensis SP1PR4]